MKVNFDIKRFWFLNQLLSLYVKKILSDTLFIRHFAVAFFEGLEVLSNRHEQDVI